MGSGVGEGVGVGVAVWVGIGSADALAIGPDGAADGMAEREVEADGVPHAASSAETSTSGTR